MVEVDFSAQVSVLVADSPHVEEDCSLFMAVVAPQVGMLDRNSTQVEEDWHQVDVCLVLDSPLVAEDSFPQVE